MAYRNGTYVAFNGCGTTDPTKGDIKYYNIIKAWNNNQDIDFDFINSHEKTSQVMDSSKKDTLLRRLQERMRNSKNMLVIITENSSNNKGLLNWEIEQCVLQYDMPIIIAYTMCDGRLTSPISYKRYLPSRLAELIETEKAKCIHISFKKQPIMAAIDKFSINDKPKWSNTHYTDETYSNWGIQ